MNVCLSLFLLLGVFLNPALSDDAAKNAMNNADKLLAANLTVLNNDAFLVAQNATSSAEYLTEAQTYGQLYKQAWNKTLGQYLLTSINDTTTYRRYLIRQRPGVAGLDQDKYNDYLGNVQSMKNNYKQKICPYSNKNCKEDDKIDVSDVENIMANTTDVDTAALKYYWQTFQNTAAKPSRDAFISASQHMNDAATLYQNGYTDAAEMSLQPYVTVDFTAAQVRDQVEQLWAALRPHYVSLMAYVRWKLRQNDHLKKSIGAADAALPAHILGSLSGGSWENLYDLVAPFPKEKLPEFNLTGNATTDFGKLEDDMQLKWKVFSNKTMPTIWAKIDRKATPDLECQPSVFDLFEGNPNHTYGLAMCGDKQTKTEVLDAHELLGQVGYMDAYNTQQAHLAFRAPGNPAMMEAAGGAVGLSAASMQYISQHGTITNITNNKAHINQLMYMALRKFAVLPYAYVMDSFRYQVYNGSVSSDYNYNWWTLRLAEQGILPPVRRERNDDFDVGGHYAVAHNMPLTSQFLGILLQFQLHEKMCSDQGQNDTTICNIAGNGVTAGFKSMMESGNKQPWTKTLNTFLAGNDSTDFPINADAINNYFKDLWTYLNETTQEENYKLGWSTDLSKQFVEHIPATVPIIVGAVLAAMIVVVVIAYFVGKKRSAGAEDTTPSVEEGAGSTNHGYEMEERKESSASSSSSSSDGSKASKH